MPPALDTHALTQWADADGHLPGAGELTATSLGEGHSNLTYSISRQVDGEERKWVLRRPPEGPLLPTAHDVIREFRVLALLGNDSASVRVPAVVASCTDDSVLGVPFFIMETSPGVVVRSTLPAFLDDPARRHALGLDVADALAEIHRANWRAFVDAGVGKPSGYLDRQLRRWVGQREGIEAAVASVGGTARSLPDYDAVRDWLGSHIPAEVEPAVVHGDYKLDNVIVDAPGRITAVVDWEMATVGDPRADVGYLLSFWPEPGEEWPLSGLLPPGDGFPSRAEVVTRWAESAGRPIPGPEMNWFVTLAVWKLAILLEASYHRWLAGQSDDPFFAHLETGVPALLARAREVCGA